MQLKRVDIEKNACLMALYKSNQKICMIYCIPFLYLFSKMSSCRRSRVLFDMVHEVFLKISCRLRQILNSNRWSRDNEFLHDQNFQATSSARCMTRL